MNFHSYSPNSRRESVNYGVCHYCHDEATHETTSLPPALPENVLLCENYAQKHFKELVFFGIHVVNSVKRQKKLTFPAPKPVEVWKKR